MSLTRTLVVPYLLARQRFQRLRVPSAGQMNVGRAEPAGFRIQVLLCRIRSAALATSKRKYAPPS